VKLRPLERFGETTSSNVRTLKSFSAACASIAFA
jgi:hypothetical protein